MPIGALVTMTALPGKADDLLVQIKEAMVDSRTEAGNLMAVVLIDPKEPDQVHIFEILLDEAAIAVHKAAPHAVARTPKVAALLSAPVAARRFETLDWPASLKVVP